jgi:hypothetical protein
MRMGSAQNSVRWDRAPSAGRASLKARTLTIATLCLAALLSLAGCDFPGLGLTAAATSTAPTPSVTATPVPWGGAPHQLPAGWTAYYAPHFSIALPPEWRVEPIWLHKDPRPEWWRMRYVLFAPQNVSRGAVEEWDDLSATRVRNDFCVSTASYEARTVAGLSMRFSEGLGPMGTGSYSPFERDWTFISGQGTVYHLWVDDSPNSNVDRHIEMNRAVVETFAPQYATWGCA